MINHAANAFRMAAFSLAQSRSASACVFLKSNCIKNSYNYLCITFNLLKLKFSRSKSHGRMGIWGERWRQNPEARREEFGIQLNPIASKELAIYHSDS